MMSTQLPASMRNQEVVSQQMALLLQQQCMRQDSVWAVQASQESALRGIASSVSATCAATPAWVSAPCPPTVEKAPTVGVLLGLHPSGAPGASSQPAASDSTDDQLKVWEGRVPGGANRSSNAEGQ